MKKSRACSLLFQFFEHPYYGFTKSIQDRMAELFHANLGDYNVRYCKILIWRKYCISRCLTSRINAIAAGLIDTDFAQGVMQDDYLTKTAMDTQVIKR